MKDLKLKEIIKNINIIIPRNIRNSWFVLMPKFNEISKNIFSTLFVSTTEVSVSTYKKGKIERTPATSNNTLTKVIKSNNKQSFSSLGDKIYK
jgi:hypothetical protein